MNHGMKKLDEDTLQIFEDLLDELACYPQEVVSDADYLGIEKIYFKLGGKDGKVLRTI